MPTRGYEKKIVTSLTILKEEAKATRSFLYALLLTYYIIESSCLLFHFLRSSSLRLQLLADTI